LPRSPPSQHSDSFDPGAGGHVFLALVSILVILCATVQVQHAFFGAKFPENRIATVFLPLFVFALAAACRTIPAPLDHLANVLLEPPQSAR
jgi:hypothetical protein